MREESGRCRRVWQNQNSAYTRRWGSRAKWEGRVGSQEGVDTGQLDVRCVSGGVCIVPSIVAGDDYSGTSC